jgi:hypothetical protein
MSSSIYSSATATATGADAIITVPSNQKWKIKCGLMDLNASSASGTRTAAVEANVGGNQVAFVPSAYQQTSGQHIYYMFGLGIITNSSLTEGDDITIGFPEVVLGPGDNIRTAFGGLDSGDVATISVNYEASLV